MNRYFLHAPQTLVLVCLPASLDSRDACDQRPNVFRLSVPAILASKI